MIPGAAFQGEVTPPERDVGLRGLKADIGPASGALEDAGTPDDAPENDEIARTAGQRRFDFAARGDHMDRFLVPAKLAELQLDANRHQINAALLNEVPVFNIRRLYDQVTVRDAEDENICRVNFGFKLKTFPIFNDI